MLALHRRNVHFQRCNHCMWRPLAVPLDEWQTRAIWTPRRAVMLLEDLCRHTFAPDAVTYGALISASEASS